MSGSKHFIMFFYYAHTQCKFCSSVSAAEVNIVQYATHIDPGTFPKPIQEDSSTILLAKHTSSPRACKWFRQLRQNRIFHSLHYCARRPFRTSSDQKSVEILCIYTYWHTALCACIHRCLCVHTNIPLIPSYTQRIKFKFWQLKTKSREQSQKFPDREQWRSCPNSLIPSPGMHWMVLDGPKVIPLSKSYQLQKAQEIQRPLNIHSQGFAG